MGRQRPWAGAPVLLFWTKYGKCHSCCRHHLIDDAKGWDGQGKAQPATDHSSGLVTGSGADEHLL